MARSRHPSCSDLQLVCPPGGGVEVSSMTPGRFRKPRGESHVRTTLRSILDHPPRECLQRHCPRSLLDGVSTSPSNHDERGEAVDRQSGLEVCWNGSAPGRLAWACTCPSSPMPIEASPKEGSRQRPRKSRSVPRPPRPRGKSKQANRMRKRWCAHREEFPVCIAPQFLMCTCRSRKVKIFGRAADP